MTEGQIRRQNELLEAIRRSQTGYIAGSDSRHVFSNLLADLVRLTDSEYGFLDEVLHDPDGTPYKLSLALTDISWSDETRILYRRLVARDLEFRNLANLAGAPAISGNLVIANDPGHDARSGGLPPGHPALRCYMGMPLHFGGELVGVAGVANRPGGYDEALAAWLEPFVTTCASIIVSERANQRQREHVATLQRHGQAVLAILNAVPESLFLMEPDGTVVAGNETLGRRLGRPVADLIGQNVFALLPQDTAAARRQWVEQAVNTRSRVAFEDTRSDREFEHAIFPIVDENGRVVHLAVFGADITQRRQAERQAAQQRAQAMQADRFHALGEMAANVAHELNQPLNGIRAFAEGAAIGLRQGWPVHQGELLESLSDIVAQVDRATEIIDHMRGFARDPDALTPTVFTLRQVVDGATKLLGTQLRARSIAVDTEVSDDLMPCQGRANQLEQVLLNLVANARDAIVARAAREAAEDQRQERQAPTPWRGQIKIKAQNATAGPAVQLTVADNGGGLAPAAEGRLFEPFFTTKPVGQGTGLGLAIAYAIVSEHRGRIDVENRPGDGVTFTVVLPAASG
jgi:PAS domain S-box-containing protein